MRPLAEVASLLCAAAAKEPCNMDSIIRALRPGLPSKRSMQRSTFAEYSVRWALYELGECGHELCAGRLRRSVQV